MNRFVSLLANLLPICFICYISSPLISQTHGDQVKATELRISPVAQAWVNQTLHHLTLEEKVGQMLQIGVFGDYRSFTQPGYVVVRNEIQKYHIGSVELYDHMFGPNLVKGTPVQVATILNQLQKDSKLPLLVGADIERGLASRLSDCPEFPFPMAFGAIGTWQANCLRRKSDDRGWAFRRCEAFIDNVLNAGPKKTLVIAMGSPYFMSVVDRIAGTRIAGINMH